MKRIMEIYGCTTYLQLYEELRDIIERSPDETELKLGHTAKIPTVYKLNNIPIPGPVQQEYSINVLQLKAAAFDEIYPQLLTARTKHFICRVLETERSLSEFVDSIRNLPVKSTK